ncbi:DUF2993 domain-containing protein [Actinomadura atramentaria]|uniref:LmeA family phospholipid-binding protein n=1 Tax=Actinomadura atramentaria TaxID=1990 RepID=UPI00035D629B|nr:DUF2993 domain-containing protein [Actinomadura atramentaria]
MRKFLLVLLVLVVIGLVAADRVGVHVAEDQISDRVQAEYNLSSPPDATIHGIPFLTQAVGGKYGHIEVKIGDWTQEGVTVSDVTVDMEDVHASLDELAAGNASNIVADKATASAVIPYAAIRKEAPKEVTGMKPEGDKLKMDLQGEVLGFRLTGDATVKLKATDKGIVITPVSFGNSSLQIPVAALSWTVPVTNLPVGSRISGVKVTPEGLRVSATAYHVNLSEVEKQAP